MVAVADGVRLHVADEGSGPAVVLVGGYGMPGEAWRLQRDHLRQRCRVVTVDRRSHGRSDRPSHGQRISRHAADLAHVLEALDLRDALLVGSSMGASTCLAHADLHGAGRTSALVLVDQTPKLVNEDDWDLGFFGLQRAGLDDWVRSFPDGLNPFHTVPPPELLGLMADGPEFSVDATRALLRNHAEQDWRDVVERLPVPLVAVAGRHSPVWPWQSSAWMAEHAPDGRLEVLEHSGHVPFLEEPAAFNEVLDRCLQLA